MDITPPAIGAYVKDGDTWIPASTIKAGNGIAHTPPAGALHLRNSSTGEWIPADASMLGVPDDGGPALTPEEGDARYLQLIGGTMTGPIELSADPNNPLEAATKQYVDAHAGVPGPIGPQGAQGDAGPAGPIGPRGDTGPQGVAGPQGIPGVDGPDGATGPQGAQGVPGPVGPAGLNWRGLWTNTASYLLNDSAGDSGSSWFCIATTSPSGIPPSADPLHWALLAAEGADGPQGPSGPTGATGPEGPQGPQGVAGTQGVAGSVGASGDEGPQGDTGDIGPIGPQGAIGPQGIPGLPPVVGDVKSGFQLSDHAGWIFLNGRAVSTLTPTQQTNAVSLGLTPNLPNALGAVPLQTTGKLGAIAGSMSRTLSQANLPNVTLNSNNTGAHTHTTDNKGNHHHLARACTNDGGTVGFSELLAGYSQPGLVGTIWRRPATIANRDNGNLAMTGRMMDDAGAHTHTAQSAGAHAHTVSLGGSGSALDITPKSLAVNMFVYLGAS